MTEAPAPGPRPVPTAAVQHLPPAYPERAPRGTAALLWSGAVAIRRLRAGRIAFWVPLLAGVLTGIVMLVAVGLLMGGDPAFQEFVQAPAAP